MKDKLAVFDKFSAISTKQWKQKIQFLLNGADYNQQCVWQSHEEISINPFYNAETTSDKEFHSSRNTRVLLPVQTLQEVIENADFDYFIINNVSEEEIATLAEKEISFKTIWISASFDNVSKFVENQLFEKVILGFDPIGNLSKTGNFYKNKIDDFSQWKLLFEKQRIIYIDASFFAEAGATKIQQIAYAFSILSEYLNLVEYDDNQSIKVFVEFTQQADFYLEIAKIKAFRWIFESVFSEFQNIELQIITRPSSRNISLFTSDEKNNEIRHKWALQSGIFGGSDYLVPCGLFYQKNNLEFIDFSQKIIQNTNENWINGSFFFGNSISQMAQKSLTLWREIEKGRGYLSALKQHIIQRKIKEKAVQSQTLFNEKIVNKSLNLHEKVFDYFPKKNLQKTLVEPILSKRISQEREISTYLEYKKIKLNLILILSFAKWNFTK